MVKKDKFGRYERRAMSTKSITVPNQSLSIRYLIDRVAKGLPVNSKMREHIPLPDDGEDLNDFETGTEVVTDVTDAVDVVDRIRAQQAYIAEEKRKAYEQTIGKVDTSTSSETATVTET